jgi:hypothetical protein
VVYAAGGVSAEQIRKGARYVAELQREMDRTRRERLQLLGFEPAAASQMSAYHTRNFMRSPRTRLGSLSPLGCYLRFESADLRADHGKPEVIRRSRSEPGLMGKRRR